MFRKSPTGFTLAELLIALAILGVIATFTIPKVLQSQQDTKYKAIAKESVATFAQAYQAYALKQPVTASTNWGNFLSYVNYVKKETTGLIDDLPGSGSLDCGDGNWDCYRLHNGAIIAGYLGFAYGTTDNLSTIYFYLDPDAKYSGSTNGPGKSMVIYIYITGKVTSMAALAPGTHDSWGGNYPTGGTPSYDPSWFSWN
jgi:prepilin-type N-terminal cleavage/methylation domain-containing protein